jgi:hypothetical protein
MSTGRKNVLVKKNETKQPIPFKKFKKSVMLGEKAEFVA